MRVARQLDESKTLIGRLQFIAEFLNAVRPETTPSQWREYLKEYLRYYRKKHVPLGPLIAFGTTGQRKASVTLRKAKEVRQFIASDLHYLHFDREQIPTPETPFGPLTIRLNEHFKAGSWHCAVLGTSKAEPGQAILTLKRHDGTQERWATTFVPFRCTRTFEESLYAILGRALLTGTLGRLKVCRQCGKYLVAVKDRKRDFCEGTTCKQDFHNHERGGTTYYKDHRQKQRKKAIEKGSQLYATGRARKVPDHSLFEQIVEKTGLPRREVDKIFERGLNVSLREAVPPSGAVV